MHENGDKNECIKRIYGDPSEENEIVVPIVTFKYIAYIFLYKK